MPISKDEKISSAKISRSILLKNKADLTHNAARCKENLTQFFQQKTSEIGATYLRRFTKVTWTGFATKRSSA
jgi:hypothetical protein